MARQMNKMKSQSLFFSVNKSILSSAAILIKALRVNLFSSVRH